MPPRTAFLTALIFTPCEASLSRAPPTRACYGPRGSVGLRAQQLPLREEYAHLRDDTAAPFEEQSRRRGAHVGCAKRAPWAAPRSRWKGGARRGRRRRRGARVFCALREHEHDGERNDE